MRCRTPPPEASMRIPERLLSPSAGLMTSKPSMVQYSCDEREIAAQPPLPLMSGLAPSS